MDGSLHDQPMHWKGLYELKNSQCDVLKKKANINRLTLFKRRETESCFDKPDPDHEPTNKKTESTSDRPMTTSKKPLPPQRKATKKRHLTSSIGNKMKKHVIVINSDTESDEDGESSDIAWIEIRDTKQTNDDLLVGWMTTTSVPHSN